MWKMMFPLSAMALLAATATALPAQITTLVPSDNLKASANTLRTGTGVTKRIQVAHGGKVRVSFDMAHVAGRPGPATCNVSNGDTSFQTDSTTFETKETDVPVEARGIVELVCFGSFSTLPEPGTSGVKVRNFRVFYNITNRSDNPVVIQN